MVDIPIRKVYRVEISNSSEHLTYFRPNFLLIQRLFPLSHELSHRLSCQKLLNQIEKLSIIEKAKTLDDQIMVDLYVFYVELYLLAELFLFGKCCLLVSLYHEEGLGLLVQGDHLAVLFLFFEGFEDFEVVHCWSVLAVFVL